MSNSPISNVSQAAGNLVPVQTELVPAPLLQGLPVAAPRRATTPAMNPRVLLRVLKRCWKLALLLGVVLSAGAAAAAWFLMPIKVRVSSLLHVAAAEPTILEQSRPEGKTQFLMYQQTQMALLKSRPVLNAVLRQEAVKGLSFIPKEAESLMDWFQDTVQVDFKLGQEIMRISMSGDRVDEMTTFINAVTEAYLTEVVNKEFIRKNERWKHLTKVQKDYEDALSQRRKEVRNLVLAVGSGNPEVIAVKQRLAHESLGAVQKELLAIQSERRRLELEIKLKEGKSADGSPPFVSEAEVSKKIEKDQVVSQIRKALAEVEGRIAANERVMRPDAKRIPVQVESLYDKRKNLQKALETTRKSLREQARDELIEAARKDQNASLGALKERYALTAKLEESLKTHFENLQEQTHSDNVKQTDIESFKVEIDQLNRITNRIADEARTLDVELKAPRRIEKIEDASASQAATERARLRVTIIAGLVGLFLAVGLVGWREYRVRRIASMDEVTNELGVKVMGAVPPLRGRRSVGDTEWQNLLTEHIDTARTQLLHTSRAQGMRVLLVTSAVGGEGKTSLSCHLATSLARAGNRTLLVDGDMRRPAAHLVLGATAGPGLSEVLRQEVPLAQAIQPTTVPSLWLMPAGNWNSSASQGLAGKRFPEILQTLRQEYEYVIFDSAPVLLVVDSLLLAQHVDGVILSLLHEVSQQSLAQTACQRLNAIGVRLLGAIVSGTYQEGSPHGYSYGAGRGARKPYTPRDPAAQAGPSGA